MAEVAQARRRVAWALPDSNVMVDHVIKRWFAFVARAASPLAQGGFRNDG